MSGTYAQTPPLLYCGEIFRFRFPRRPFSQTSRRVKPS